MNIYQGDPDRTGQYNNQCGDCVQILKSKKLTNPGLLNLVNQGFSDGAWKLRAQRLSVLSGAWGRLPPALSSLLSRPC